MSAAVAWRRVVGFVVGVALSAWFASIRLTLVVHPSLAARGSARNRRVLVFWHGEQLLLLRWARSQRMAALVSRSLDGELAASALARSGIGAVRGSSSRGGVAGLRGVVRALRAGSDVAIALDGPRGPARVVRADSGRAGAAVAAHLGAADVVPMAAACSCARRLRSWDAFAVPWPFARVVVALGAPLAPDEATPGRLSAALGEATAAAEERLAAAA